ncbi:conserved hypothetical protein [Talaromyces stipitatus ATCC 10500]|uniref:T6SS Phospholipase effector Tle1-like catalytic domain-containing protein n=1 Tax=Talaromyces stipitatus (strain ATCC 10500 / CBS 375.48 / QM 6759 / NRRL 1006) TaxID=441959 RepID=B8MAD7_TALSN|nr:uncharacterized protein TSTA_123680 [Talaromyces stipitatus ATCC 10500]EED18639.1 conserved hypothetical protein [Talaromyces stipitatus ATCC 10500]
MGNPSELKFRVSLNKRLIVCCDGTWEDGTSDEIDNPLSNITRIARSIRQHAEIIDANGDKILIPQITYYQKGVGTGVLDQYLGGLTGVGLSANVRAAYAFLAENYEPGDELFFFGFSRGAYTARAVAGLVADMGLLTPRGMDNFPIIYHDYYKKKRLSYDDDEDMRRKLGFRDKLPRFTIRVIGVFDTVGFHDFRFTSKIFGEKFELPNTILSPDVRYAFHALALDERRKAFEPTLWHTPQRVPDQELLQVWFSGAHADVGGGAEDPRLSDIALAWMIAHASKDKQLDFDLTYLFHDPAAEVSSEQLRESALRPWTTSLGQEDHWKFTQYVEALVFGKGNRTPLLYVDGNDQVGYTNEWIHESVKDRRLNKFSEKGPALDAKVWPSKVIARRIGGEHGEREWMLKDGQIIREVGATPTELFLKGRIRKVRAIQVDPA